MEEFARIPDSRVLIDWGHGVVSYAGDETAWTVNREITTDLPEVMRSGAGVGAATANVLLAPATQDPQDPEGPSVLSVSSVGYDQAGPSLVSVPAPAGVQDGDILIAYHTSDTFIADMGDPQGSGSWDVIFELNAINAHFRVWYRVASGEPTDYEFQVNGQFVDTGVISIVAVRNAEDRQPAVAGRLFRERSGDFPTPGVDPVGSPDFLELRILSGSAYAPAVVWFFPPGFVEIANLVSGFEAYNGVIASRQLTTAGNTGDQVFTGETLSPFGYIDNVLKASSTTSATSWVFTFSQNAPAGTQVFGAVHFDASGGVLPVLTITDSEGNSWTELDSVVAGTTVSSHVFTCLPTNGIVGGVSTLTITSSVSRSRVAVSIDAFSGTYDVLDITTATNTGSGTSLVEVGPIGASDGLDRLLFGAFGFGTDRTLTPDAPFLTSGEVCSGTGGGHRCGSNVWHFDGEHLVTGTLSSASTYSAVAASIVVRSTDGDSVHFESATGVTLTLAQEPPVSNVGCVVEQGHWSPFRHDGEVPSRVNRDVTIHGGFQDETDLHPLFTGTTNRAQGSTVEPELSLECVDLSTRLQHQYRIPTIISEISTGPGGYAPGLDALWVIDNIFRSGGFNHLIPLEDEAVFSASFLGSAQPELFVDDGMTSPFPYRATNFGQNGPVVFDHNVSFAPIGVNNLNARYGIRPANTLSNGGIMVMFYVDWSRSAANSVCTIALRNASDGSVALRVLLDRNAQTVTVDNGSAGVSRVSPGSGLHIVAIRGSEGTFTSVEVRIYHENQQIGTSFGVLTFDNDELKTSITITDNGIRFGGLQIVDYETLSPHPQFDHVPNVEYTHSLNSLIGTPGISGQTAWQALSDVVSAEMGGVWIDEEGKGIFRNRDAMRGVGVPQHEATAASSLVSIQWEESREHEYGSVRVPYLPLRLEQNLEVYRIPEALRLTPGQVVSRIVSLDSPTLGPIMVTRANTLEDGSGTDLGPITVLQMELVDNTTARFQARNDFGQNVFLVFPDGSGGLYIEASYAVVENNAEFVSANAAPGNDATLEVEENIWRQTEPNAHGAAQWLSTQVDDPLPVLTSVTVRPDLAIRLGDVINLRDPIATEIEQLALVVGVTATMVSGEVTQDLVIRLLDITWGQFDSVWAGDSTFITTTYDTPGSTTFAVPMAGMYDLRVSAWGSGAAGMISDTGQTARGGGGAGAYASSRVPVVAGETLDLQIGAGGVITGGAGPDQDGEPSQVLRGGTPLVSAVGGERSLTAGGSGLGGLATDSVGVVRFSGGDGGPRQSATTGGGGGGGAAGSTMNGNVGDPGSGGGFGGVGGGSGGRGGRGPLGVLGITAGGDGGDGGHAPDGGHHPGLPGVQPGGGGGGQGNQVELSGPNLPASGDGGHGRIVLRYTVSQEPLRTWNEFDTVWQGETWADFDQDQTRVTPLP